MRNQNEMGVLIENRNPLMPIGVEYNNKSEAIQRKINSLFFRQVLLATILLLAYGCDLSQVKETSQKGEPVITPITEQKAALRPILHFDIAKYFNIAQKKEGKLLITKGVYPDGQSLGPLLRGIGATWSPDGIWFAYIKEGKSVTIRNLQGEEKVIFTSDNERPFFYYICWSPDGKQLAFISHVPGNTLDENLFSVVVIDAAKSKELSRYRLPSATSANFPEHFSLPSKFRWSPDGRKILLVWGNAAIVDTETGTIETIQGKGRSLIAEWAPSSDAVYYFDSNFDSPKYQFGDFYFKKLGASKPVKLMDKEKVESLGLGMIPIIRGLINLSPKGSKLLIAGEAIKRGGGEGLSNSASTYTYSGRIYIYDVSDGKTVALDKPYKEFQTDDLITSFEWAPDENSLAAVVLTKEFSTGARIKVLDLLSGIWRIIATVDFEQRWNAEIMDICGLKILSWTQ